MSDLEPRLQAWGRGEAAAAGTPPPFSVGAQRRSWVPVALSAAAALLVALGGFILLSRTSSSPPRPAAPEVVPWASLPAPSEPGSSDDPSVRTCRATDLRASAPDPGEGATGTWIASFTLTNASPTPCRLTGRLDGLTGVLNGGRAAVHVSNETTLGDFVPAVLAPGESGQLFYSYYRRCDTTQPATTPVYRDLELTLLGGVVPVAGATLDLGCDPPETGIAAGLLGRPPQEPAPASAALTGALHLPASVAAGTSLRYTVTLSNPTDEPLAFEPCPGYEQVLAGPTKARETWGLNCPEARPVPAHGSETFAMELAVPAGARPGTAVLSWQLAVPEATEATGTVEVTAPSATATPPGADVVGLDVDTAVQRLAAVDCSATVGAIVNRDAPVGQVVDQRRTSDLCELSLTVSAGPRSSAPPCTHLTITAGLVGVGAGHAGFPVRFRNSGSTVCSLTGYPSVTGTDSRSGKTVTAGQTPSGYLGGSDLPVAEYFLAPGEQVSALVEGTDVPEGNATSCEDLNNVHVVVNGVSSPGRSLSDCSGMEVHPFVPGTTGRA